MDDRSSDITNDLDDRLGPNLRSRLRTLKPVAGTSWSLFKEDSSDASSEEGRRESDRLGALDRWREDVLVRLKTMCRAWAGSSANERLRRRDRPTRGELLVEEGGGREGMG